jgi:hypothetical protein
VTSSRSPRIHERWAHLRFSVIGQLLAAPPAKGELCAPRSPPWRHANGAIPTPVRPEFRLLHDSKMVLHRVAREE